MGNESTSSASVVALYKLTNKKIILINRKNKKKNKEKKEKKKENRKMKKKNNSKRKANVTKKQIENFFTFICNISLPAVSVTEYKGPTAMHDLATTVYR